MYCYGSFPQFCVASDARHLPESYHQAWECLLQNMEPEHLAPNSRKKTTKTVYRWVETSPKKDQRESPQPTHRLFIQTSFSAFSSLPIFWRPTYGQNSKKKKSDISSLILHLPSGNLTYLWKITIFDGNIHYFYGHFQQLCEIILNYQRVNPINSH